MMLLLFASPAIGDEEKMRRACRVDMAASQEKCRQLSRPAPEIQWDGGPSAMAERGAEQGIAGRLLGPSPPGDRRPK
jgi:hypothetical protein